MHSRSVQSNTFLSQKDRQVQRLWQRRFHTKEKRCLKRNLHKLRWISGFSWLIRYKPPVARILTIIPMALPKRRDMD